MCRQRQKFMALFRSSVIMTLLFIWQMVAVDESNDIQLKQGIRPLGPASGAIWASMNARAFTNLYLSHLD